MALLAMFLVTLLSVRISSKLLDAILGFPRVRFVDFSIIFFPPNDILHISHLVERMHV